MAEQNLKNHGRYIFLWHIVTGIAVIATLIGSIVNLTHSSRENFYAASLLVLVALILGSIFWYARWFALRVQDRAIRADREEGRRLEYTVRRQQAARARGAIARADLEARSRHRNQRIHSASPYE